MLIELKHLVNERDYKGILRMYIKAVLPDKVSANITFLKNHKRLIHFKNPLLFDEKLLVLKSSGYLKNPLVKQCADKYAVRSYIESKGLGEILNTLYLAAEHSSEVLQKIYAAEGMLPRKVAIKCSHGSGWNCIVDDMSKADPEKICRQLDYWMEADYGILGGEWQYSGTRHMILCEKYLSDENGTMPAEYKFFCSRGKVLFCYYAKGKAAGGKTDSFKRFILDKDFKDMHMGDTLERELMKPSSFCKMIQVAEILSKDFLFVRVDLFQVEERVVFSELTFTPSGCNHSWISGKNQAKLGKLLDIY